MSTIAEYDAWDATAMAERVRAGDVHPSELVEEAIARAERVNPRLNAIVIPMYDAGRRRAKEVARDVVHGGAFAGVPFLLKDLASAYAGVALQAGSRLFRGIVPAEHGDLVKRYLDAGVVVFGKTNTPELGILPVTEPELYGPTHNPWRHGVTPGGSSGGAAAAVASGIVPMAHGGDGGGSIRIPASCCGLYGLKPSRMRQPVGPEESERFFGFAVEHVLTRSVRDSARMLDATAGADPCSIYFAPPGGDFAAGIDRDPAPLRIAFTDDPLLPAEKNPDATRAVLAAAELSERLGHHVERASPRIDRHAFARAFFLHFAAATAAELKHAESVRHRPTRASDVEASTWLLSLIGRSIDAAELVLARRTLHAESRKVMRFFERYDMLLTPTLGMPPLVHGALDPTGAEAHLQRWLVRVATPSVLKLPGFFDRAVARAYNFAPYSMVFNVTGQPSASLPLSMTDDGLPMGAMLTGRAGADAQVLALSAQIERAAPWFDTRPPIHAAGA